MSKSCKRRRTNIFNAELRKQFPYFKVGSNDSEVVCQKCFATVSIATMGRSAITQHLKQEKHKKAVDLPASASLSTFYRRVQFGEPERRLTAAEGTFTYHTVRHSMSFRSMNCSTSLIQNLFEPKFSC